MTCKTYDTGTLKQYKYVVTLSEYGGKILLAVTKTEPPGKPRAATLRPEKRPWKQPGGSCMRSRAQRILKLLRCATIGQGWKEPTIGQTEWCLQPE